MTPDQLDSLKWVQDCGGSMRAVNNPHAAWLISEGLVSKSLGVISLTPKGLGELTPATTAAFTTQKWDYNTARWSWADPAPGFDDWIRKHTQYAGPLIQCSPSDPVHGGRVLDVSKAASVGSKIAQMFRSSDCFVGSEFSLSNKTELPDIARTQMQAYNKPLICARPLSKLLPNRVSGDIDVLLTETKGIRTITVRLWT